MRASILQPALASFSGMQPGAGRGRQSQSLRAPADSIRQRGERGLVLLVQGAQAVLKARLCQLVFEEREPGEDLLPLPDRQSREIIRAVLGHEVRQPARAGLME